ncbi:MAG: HIT domain-containing protein [Candidatus Cloacimonetes bacterium]|nr:HIT domain-containing protein [Candidatus Cloacimonadota bacterium]
MGRIAKMADKHDVLYSPWRLDYVRSAKSDDCIFCIQRNPAADYDEKRLIVHRGEHSFVILNMYPYNNGHLMVAPYRHVASLMQLDENETSDLFLTVRLAERVVREAYCPDGLNIGVNLGKAAGAGIDQHLHVHLVPRWVGDHNFMTTTGGTRVIPESFESAWNRLKEQFDNAQAEK